jgi:hypothetical protein
MYFNICTSFIGWCDSNWARGINNQQSIIGYLFQRVPSCGNPRNDPIEYMAFTSATNEALWIYQLVSDLGLIIQLPI